MKTERTPRSAAVVIAVTLQRLAEDQTRFLMVEEKLVLDALRRSSNDLRDASEVELGRYIRGMEPEQLRGVVSNTKGIYHELLFARAENMDGDEITAALAGATNQPGHDIEFFSDGDIISQVQLKAVESTSSILRHMERYPDIKVLATEEVAARMDGVESTGYSNISLTEEVSEVVSELPGDGLLENIGEGIATSGLVSAVIHGGIIGHANGGYCPAVSG
jgi:hypothetical protein